MIYPWKKHLFLQYTLNFSAPSYKFVSDLETCMDYFAPPGRSCKNLNFPTHLSQMMYCGEKSSIKKTCGQNTLASQFWWLSCLGRKTNFQIFTQLLLKIQNNTFLNLRHLYLQFKLFYHLFLTNTYPRLLPHIEL